MTVETIRDVLDWTRNLHQQLSELYQNSSEDTDDERLKMLLSYIADHESKLAEAIARFENESSNANLMENWFQQFTQQNPFLQNMSNLNQLQPFNSESIMNFTVETHQKIIDMYKEMSAHAPTDNLKEIFDGLASLEISDLMRMVHTSERMDDM